ncbi:MAG TPA: sigma-70 family RNA polymerase sigma factor [Armatimonadota bacterium]|nr:sigma-70 family RNA polymerase sigma factor [Armatimonadota bacterium]
MTNPKQDTDLLPGNQAGRPRSSGEAEGAGRGGGTEPDADLALVLRVQAGDVSAFGELIDRHQRAIYGIVSRMVTSRDEADDLVQDIFVSAYRAIGSFRREAKLSTWLHTIAVNMTLKRLKKMKRQNMLSIDDPAFGLASTIRAEDDPSPDESLQQRERNDMVRRAIDTLPDKQRIVVVMHYFEQRPCDEIAAILKCSVGTVWSRLHYACRRLRGELRLLQQGL